MGSKGGVLKPVINPTTYGVFLVNYAMAKDGSPRLLGVCRDPVAAEQNASKAKDFLTDKEKSDGAIIEIRVLR